MHIKLYTREKLKRGLKISISAKINKFKRCAKFYFWSESVERCQQAFCKHFETLKGFLDLATRYTHTRGHRLEACINREKEIYLPPRAFFYIYF